MENRKTTDEKGKEITLIKKSDASPFDFDEIERLAIQVKAGFLNPEKKLDKIILICKKNKSEETKNDETTNGNGLQRIISESFVKGILQQLNTFDISFGKFVELLNDQANTRLEITTIPASKNIK